MDIKTLKPGNRIKIVDTPPKGSAFAKGTDMEMYLGKKVTITRVHERCVTIKEDRGRFAWTPMLIEKVIA